MFDLFLFGSFLVICLYILHPSKSIVMQANALLPLYDVQEGESLPDMCKELGKLDA